MVWQKGQTGNPRGRPKMDKPWREAIMLALKRGDGTINRIADRLVQMALDGDMMAIREIADRLDGKAVQPTEVISTEVVSDPQDLALERLHDIAVRLGYTLVPPCPNLTDDE